MAMSLDGAIAQANRARSSVESAAGTLEAAYSQGVSTANKLGGGVGQPSTTTLGDKDDIFDSEWVKSTFNTADRDFIRGDEYSQWIMNNRYYNSSHSKFTCTAPGMSVGVNPKPQFTRYADPRSKGKIESRPDITFQTRSYKAGLGMGDYYSMAIDDNQERIFMRFGVPKYMFLPLWIAKAFDIDKATMANRGVLTSAILKATGLVARFFAVTAAPWTAFGLFAGNVLLQNSRFFSIKPTMYLYWGTVENLLNAMMARRTMLPHVFPGFTSKKDNRIDGSKTINDTFVSSLNAMVPDLIDAETGRISVYALAMRGQAIYNNMLAKDHEKNKEVTFANRDTKGYALSEDGVHDSYFTTRDGEANFYTKRIFDTAKQMLFGPEAQGGGNTTLNMQSDTRTAAMIEYDEFSSDVDGNPIDLTLDPNNPNDTVEGRILANIDSKAGHFERMKTYLLSELTDGAAYAVFNVENTGSVSESFSNALAPNPIESTFNSIASKARNLGNLVSAATSVPVLGDIMKFAGDLFGQAVSNASLGLANPLLALAYGVNITMPKTWESASASLPKANYKIKAISVYGNAYAHVFQLYLPVAMILAGGLPRSTGRASYAAPMFCQLYHRGRHAIEVGCIDNIQLTRGTSNLAFNRAGYPNAIDIEFSVANLDEIISVDITSAGAIGNIINSASLDFSDSPLETYLNALTGVDLETQIYGMSKLRLKVAERYMNLRMAVNPDPAAFAAFTVNAVPFARTVRDILGNNFAVQNDVVRR